MFAHNSYSELLFETSLIGRPNNWSVIILCALLFLLTLLVVSFRNKLYLTLRALYSQRFYAQLLREGRIIHERVAIFTLLFDLMTLSFGALLCLERFAPRLVDAFTYIGLYGMTFAVLLVLFFFQMLVNNIYTALFDHPKEYNAMYLYKYIFLTNVSFVLFPFLILAQFSGQFAVLYAYIPFFLVDFGLYLYKLMKINPQKINLFQFFVYFCTLEILPYIVLGKMVSMY